MQQGHLEASPAGPAHLHTLDDLQRAVVHSAAQRDGAFPAVHAVVQHQGQRGGGPRHLGAVCLLESPERVLETVTSHSENNG